MRAGLRADEGLVDDELISALDEQLAARAGSWDSWSRRRIINAVDAAVLAIDPDAARQRRKDADNNRYIWVSGDRDGMAQINGKLAAAQGAAFDRCLTQLANEVCADDPAVPPTSATRLGDVRSRIVIGETGCAPSSFY